VKWGPTFQCYFEPVVSIQGIIAKQRGCTGITSRRSAVDDVLVIVGYEDIQIAIVIEIEQDDPSALPLVTGAYLLGDLLEAPIAQIFEQPGRLIVEFHRVAFSFVLDPAIYMVQI